MKIAIIVILLGSFVSCGDDFIKSSGTVLNTMLLNPPDILYYQEINKDKTVNMGLFKPTIIAHGFNALRVLNNLMPSQNHNSLQNALNENSRMPDSKILQIHLGGATHYMLSNNFAWIELGKKDFEQFFSNRNSLYLSYYWFNIHQNVNSILIRITAFVKYDVRGTSGDKYLALHDFGSLPSVPRDSIIESIESKFKAMQFTATFGKIQLENVDMLIKLKAAIKADMQTLKKMEVHKCKVLIAFYPSDPQIGNDIKPPREIPFNGIKAFIPQHGNVRFFINIINILTPLYTNKPDNSFPHELDAISDIFDVMPQNGNGMGQPTPYSSHMIPGGQTNGSPNDPAMWVAPNRRYSQSSIVPPPHVGTNGFLPPQTGYLPQPGAMAIQPGTMSTSPTHHIHLPPTSPAYQGAFGIQHTPSPQQLLPYDQQGALSRPTIGSMDQTDAYHYLQVPPPQSPSYQTSVPSYQTSAPTHQTSVPPFQSPTRGLSQSRGLSTESGGGISSGSVPSVGTDTTSK